MNANMVKTTNKLLGQVENGDLYADDEGLMDNRSQEEPEVHGELLDFGKEITNKP
jgi:hypothetical protein